jgi:PDZ domain-containing secreted protein
VRRRAPFALTALGLLLLAVVAFLWIYQSSYYLISPDAAKPLDGRVKVANGKDDQDGGGIYYVDVLVRRASLLERLVPAIRPDGATLVPADALRSPGSTEADRVRQARRQMDRSEQIAARWARRSSRRQTASWSMRSHPTRRLRDSSSRPT